MIADKFIIKPKKNQDLKKIIIIKTKVSMTEKVIFKQQRTMVFQEQSYIKDSSKRPSSLIRHNQQLRSLCKTRK